MILRPLVAWALAALLLACSRTRTQGGPPAAPDPELTKLFVDDQTARAGPIEQVDMAKLDREDSIRRERVRARVNAGSLQTALDYYHAAMVFQHGRDSADYAQAHRWVRRSEALDSTNPAVRWLVAASWDRYQMSRHLPQWYGTQTDRNPRGTGPVVLYTIDTTRVTEAERQWRGIGTLAQLRARLDTINKRLGFH